MTGWHHTYTPRNGKSINSKNKYNKMFAPVTFSSSYLKKKKP